MLTQRGSERLDWPVREQRPVLTERAATRRQPPKPGGFWQRLESLKASVEQQLAQRPVVTVATGLALGVVLGWLLKRR